jgi:hypothetical protein
LERHEPSDRAKREGILSIMFRQDPSFVLGLSGIPVPEPMAAILVDSGKFRQLSSVSSVPSAQFRQVRFVRSDSSGTT